MNSYNSQAVRAAGGAGRLASALGISRQAVLAWKRIPANRVLAVEALTGISRHKLRPDIFGFVGNSGYQPGNLDTSSSPKVL